MTIKYTNHTEFMKIAFAKAKEAQPGLTKKEFLESYKAIVSTIESELAEGNGVKLPRFLRFKPIFRKGRPARNLQTNEIIKVPDHFRLSVKPLGKLKEIVRNAHDTK